MKETESSDRATWERECRGRLDADWAAREAGLAAAARAERDAELERAVTRMEEEVARDRKRAEKDAAERIECVEI